MYHLEGNSYFCELIDLILFEEEGGRRENQSSFSERVTGIIMQSEKLTRFQDDVTFPF